MRCQVVKKLSPVASVTTNLSSQQHVLWLDSYSLRVLSEEGAIGEQVGEVILSRLLNCEQCICRKPKVLIPQPTLGDITDLAAEGQPGYQKVSRPLIRPDFPSDNCPRPPANLFQSLRRCSTPGPGLCRYHCMAFICLFTKGQRTFKSSVATSTVGATRVTP